MNKTVLKKTIGLILIALGLGILLSSIALNIRQYVSKKNTVEAFEEILKDTEADKPSASSPAVTGDMLYILRIPAIDSENPVREGVKNSVLADSLGHESGTGYIGEAGNCVIAGHRNYTFGKFFNRLDEVEVNDLIYVDTADETYTYAVKEIKVVEPEDLSVLEATPDKETLTLYTCTPIYIATHRLVIIAERI
ncbi:MAG: class D sortase [Pseudobutyrivibrio sp.]|nr:class D sortase [Pseudobutyrivibrio sp.]